MAEAKPTTLPATNTLQTRRPMKRRLTIASDDPFANIFVNGTGQSLEIDEAQTPPEKKAEKLAKKLQHM